MANPLKKPGPKLKEYPRKDIDKAWDLYITKDLTAAEAARQMKISAYRLLKLVKAHEVQP